MYFWKIISCQELYCKPVTSVSQNCQLPYQLKRIKKTLNEFKHGTPGEWGKIKKVRKLHCIKKAKYFIT